MKESTAAVVIREDCYLLVKRPPGGALSERWELPGGKVDPGETPREALARELREELAVRATVGRELARTHFKHGAQQFELIAFAVDFAVSTMLLAEHTEFRWVAADDVLSMNLAPSDRSLLERLLGSE